MEIKSLEIAARASIETGAPILVHTQLGTMAYEAAQHLIDLGVDPGRIQLSHLNKNPDPYYYEKIVRELGVTLCFDGPDRVKYYSDSTLALNIKRLVDKGFQKNITLSLDAGRVLYQRNYGLLKAKQCFGLAYLFDRFLPLLREVGVSEEAIEDMLVNNPARILSFEAPRAFDESAVAKRFLLLKEELGVE